MSEQIETWIRIRDSKCPRYITDVSNLGNVRYGGGKVCPSTMYQRVMVDRKITQISHLVAERFVPKTEEDIRLGRTLVDHKTHSPIDFNVNDYRNVRWCTHKENSNFPEAKNNMSTSMAGIAKTDFGRLFLPSITGKVRGENMNYYAWARNQFKKTGVLPSPEEYSHVYQGRKSEFAQWFNDKYGPGNQNRALYQRCYRHYKATGNFLEV